MARKITGLLVLGAVLLSSIFAFAESSVKVLTKGEYGKLAKHEQLVVSDGTVSDSGLQPFVPRSTIINKLLEMAEGLRSTDIYITKESVGKGTNSWGVSGEQLEIIAIALHYEEPSVQNIKSAIFNKSNKARISFENIKNHIIANRYTELKDVILEALNKNSIESYNRVILMEAYDEISDSNSVSELRKILLNPKFTDIAIKNKAGELLVDRKDYASVFQYLLELNAKQATKASTLSRAYCSKADKTQIDNIKKLFKYHAADDIRFQAGVSLIKFGEIAFVEEGMKSEKNDKVVSELKRELLLR